MPTTINERGFWDGNDVMNHHAFDPKLAEALCVFFRNERASSVFDMGCGPGWYIRALEPLGIVCDGVDGNPNTPHLSGGLATVADLSQELKLVPRDWVLSLEVGEHLPREYESMFIDNLHNHNHRGIVLSWAIPGQGGYGHFNERPNDYVIDRMLRKGYEYDATASADLRSKSSLSWFKNTIIVFRKTQ